MRRFSFLLVLVSAVAAAQAPASKPSNINDSDNARKARAILEQAVEALGGQAYLTYDNKLEEGRYYPMYHGRSVSTGILYARYVRYPDKERFEVRHQSGSVKIDDKNDMVVVHNGDKGYEITFKGTGPEDKADTARYVRRRLHSLDWALRKWMNQPGVAFFF